LCSRNRWRENVRRLWSAHPTDPPEPGLGYLCLLLVKLETKKFLSPERRLIALTGRLAGPDRWQAPFFLFTCVVYQNQSLQMRQRVTCLPAQIRPLSVFFGSKIRPVSAHRPHRVLWFWTQKCAKKRFVPRRGQSTRRGQIIQAQKGQGWDIFGAEIV